MAAVRLTRSRPRASALLLASALLVLEAGASGLSVAQTRRNYENPTMQKLKYGKANEFRFHRFQSPEAVKAAFADCRSPSSFKFHKGKDGRLGHVCSTKLGGDWVLAESEQIAVSCTAEQVLKAYLDGRLQKKWNADKVADAKFSRKSLPNGRKFYQQDLKLLSVRVIRSHTGPMSYSQTITVDKIGTGNYCAFVQLDPDLPSSARKPFETLGVYVGLQQRGDNVHIYAAGVFEVNRRVVPNLIVFDASGLAGDMAGKGTLWLAGHFEELRRAGGASSGWSGACKRLAQARERLHMT